MARPTDKPRLATLTPDAIAANCDERLHRHLGTLAFALGVGATIEVKQHGESDLAATLRALTVYAQRGLPVWDWETHGEAADAVLDVVSKLYGRPSDAGKGMTSDVGPLGDVADDLDLDDPIDLVVVAANARVELSRGEGLTVRQLAALAGLDPSIVRRMAKDGEVALEGTRPAQATAKEAKRWLQARGLKGL